MTAEYLLTLLIEQYGPIGVFTAVLIYRQNRLIRAVMRLAEEQPDVDENRIQDEVRLN